MTASVSYYTKPEEFEPKVAQYVDVIGEKLGGKIVKFSDEWFAPAENLIKPSVPIRQIKFVPTGAWFDGWETRRHNPEYDWVIIKLGVDSATLVGCEVDTAHFTGNAAPAISVEACYVENEAQLDKAQWENVIPEHECLPNHRQFFLRDGETQKAYSHVKLCMYPDGGIARFRLYGKPVAVFPQDLNQEVDLAHVSNGGVAVSFSDQHFGTANNLLLPGRGHDMSDGWETKRSRGKDHVDWVVIQLGAAGHVDRVCVDTAHYLGNFPQYITLHGLKADKGEVPSHDDKRWKSIVPKSKTSAGQEHFFDQLDSSKDEVFTHVKFTMIPDGGVKRVRVFGRRAAN
uniref:allantoicase n=1 Tax=Blastobotrys adeninivorans TaxID=409370 RepID=A0A060SWQ1_BLAAD